MPIEQDEQHQHDGRAQNQQAEPPESALELRFGLARPQPGGDVAEHGPADRWPSTITIAGAADDRRAEKHEMRRVRPLDRPRAPSAADACLSAGSDSPVSIDCCTDRSRDSISRPSAGTRSPADRRTRSPGTTRRRGTSCQAPSRRTVAVGVDRRAQAFGRLLRSIRLPEVDRDADQHHRDDDDGVHLAVRANAEIALATSRMTTSGLANRKRN